MEIMHTWPSVRTTKILSINGASSISIPAGNWDAESFANYINQQLGQPTRLVYDSARLKYIFNPSIVVQGATTCQGLLGLESGQTGTFSESTQPVNFSGPTHINVDSNLSLFNVPISGRLASIPIDKSYGECIQYVDQSGIIPTQILDHQVSLLTMKLTDQDGEELDTYNDIPWFVTLELTDVSSP